MVQDGGDLQPPHESKQIPAKTIRLSPTLHAKIVKINGMHCLQDGRKVSINETLEAMCEKWDSLIALSDELNKRLSSSQAKDWLQKKKVT